ncbi:MAG: hypothetical protein EZS28_012568 [Streblomastix strix]|uniref:Uncharacterized protein n=1 Tax=Streblomastix strix TaxID=222440 RepID=A0A5J4WAH2_9EUKA|nr:MAG: hypothetical protein EZS28_012568 [Streblomastix strix]
MPSPTHFYFLSLSYNISSTVEHYPQYELDYIYGKSKDISNLAELYPRTGTSIEQVEWMVDATLSVSKSQVIKYCVAQYLVEILLTMGLFFQSLILSGQYNLDCSYWVTFDMILI